ncbi:MAG: nuclear transport factor 2 family protein [Chitinophaga sp.]|uniref:nuclear transport factor 2 family protein n=1 Tax=Chitinophaga sp. TaxID=1869181 RepID=UPI001B107E5C|nr:nuclear transport factor 2 family protein [Chitinophaga sp.]MBO9728480.1 nuclear transport factor 2 family protein [Chitinophaga sp.]
MTIINNRAIVLAAVKQLIGERNADAVDIFLHENYIQHSPQVKDGRAGLREAISQLKQLPAPPAGQASPIVRTIAEGDYVMLHMDIAFMGRKMAVVDLYRLEAGKLAEHWEATQEQPVGGSLTSGTSTITAIDQTAENKQLMQRFFDQPDRALLAPDYVNHDVMPFFPQERTVHRIIGEGNFVLVQSSGILDGQPAVFYDICRVTQHLVAEHWRVAQKVPSVLPHTNGMI